MQTLFQQLQIGQVLEKELYKNAETNITPLLASSHESLLKMPYNSISWSGCVCCPFTAYRFEHNLGNSVVQADVEEVRFLMIDRVLNGCNAKPAYDMRLQSLSIRNPSPIQKTNQGCCDEFRNTIDTYGDGNDRQSVAGVSVQWFELGGQLCFHDVIIDGLSNPYGVQIEINGRTVYGKIKATGKFKNNEVVYVSPTGSYYRGKLTSSQGFSNTLTYVGECKETELLDRGLSYPIFNMAGSTHFNI